MLKLGAADVSTDCDLRIHGGTQPRRLDHMTSTDTRIDPLRSLATDVALADQFTRVFERAEKRQVWLMFLDNEHRLTGPLMPMDELPTEPDEPCSTEDLGVVRFAKVLVERARMVAEFVGAHQYLWMWERRGSGTLSHRDRRWAAAISEESDLRPGAGGAPAPLRAQLLLHDDGARLITPDDLD